MKIHAEIRAEARDCLDSLRAFKMDDLAEILAL